MSTSAVNSLPSSSPSSRRASPPAGLFTVDAFCDFTMPQWRLQFEGVEDIVAGRKAGHPSRGRVPRSRFDATTTGFVLEVEEEWDQDGEAWYCREMFRADVVDRVHLEHLCLLHR